MDYKHIKELLEKYFDGETSLQEEARLKEYFANDNIPEPLRKYQPLFQYFTATQQVSLDESFDKQLLNQLQRERQPQLHIRHLNTWVLRVAAAVAIALGVWWLLPEEPPAETASIDWSKYEPKTVEEAYTITREALMKTSSELNRGASTAANEVSKVRKMREVLD